MSKNPTSRRHPLGPRVPVTVTAELITVGVRADSGHCMIAESIKAAVPTARHVAVDISTCRFTDPDRGLRYVYLTPRIAQEALVDFDEGIVPGPFKFLLRGAHVSKAGHTERRRVKEKEAAKKRREASKRGTDRARLITVKSRDTGVIPRRVGGERPPQLRLRREFGMRAFRAASLRRLAAEQPDIPVDQD